MPDVWFCHQCEAQIEPEVVEGVSLCPNCGSDFLESVAADDPPSPPLGHGPRDRGFEYQDLQDDDDFPVPGAFPSSPHSVSSPQAHPSPSTPIPRRQQGPLFRFGMGGGSITIGGGSGGSGRRTGFGAEQGSPGPLRTSYIEGVPTPADFLSSSINPVRARSPDFFPQFGGPSPSNGLPRRNEMPGGDLMDIMNGLLGMLSEGSPRGGRLGAADDPYMQMLRSQGGLGALFGGGRGSFGDYVGSQEAFDRVVTQLAQAAGPSSDRPPPASSSMIHSLPTIPIDSVLVAGLDQKECTICMSEFEVGEDGKKMPCTHLFHRHCLETWLETNGTCPVCRFSLLTMGATEVSGSRDHQDHSTQVEAGGRSSTSAASGSGLAAESSTPSQRGSEIPLRTSGAAAGTGARGRDAQGDLEGAEPMDLH